MKRVLALVLLGVLLGFPSAAHADVAPPARPPGSNLIPGTETTEVRMVAETVLIDVQARAPEKSLGQAHVTADFTMRNLGETAESMAARFPIGATDGWSSVNQITDLQVKVGGQPVPTRRITGEDPYNSQTAVPWDEFDVIFPPGQDVAIQVRYTLEASGEYPYVWFKYILSTGAAWKGTIGSADIIVQLPYEANAQNLLLPTDEPWVDTPRGGTVQGNSIRWHYSDLEPTTQDNFDVDLVMPSAWENLLRERWNVEQNPRDGEAWGRLGKLCKEMSFSSRGKGFRSAAILDPGAAELYQESLQAYDKAVTLLPNDALWHAGYADLLGYHAYFEKYNGTDTREEAIHSLKELQIALELSPNDPKIQEIAYEFLWFFPQGIKQEGDKFQFPWLTATPDLPTVTLAPPTEVAQEQPSETPLAPPTPTGQIEPTAPPQPTPQPTTAPASSPLCGSALVLPVLVVGLFLWNSKRKGPVS